jgi:hypothetical protein
MTDVVLCIMAVIGGSLALELFAASTAPLGYQDQEGFHFGVETLSDVDELQLVNPS